jgi:hypothetical protein
MVCRWIWGKVSHLQLRLATWEAEDYWYRTMHYNWKQWLTKGWLAELGQSNHIHTNFSLPFWIHRALLPRRKQMKPADDSHPHQLLRLRTYRTSLLRSLYVTSIINWCQFRFSSPLLNNLLMTKKNAIHTYCSHSDSVILQKHNQQLGMWLVNSEKHVQ